MNLRASIALLMLGALFPVARAAGPGDLIRPWSARWIYAPGTPPTEYGIYHFRRTFDLPAKPTSFVVHVSGDNRYQLFVNGERVLWGPARGDLFHWRYETLDIARYLHSGKNLLAAVVWNLGADSGMAQTTYRTASCCMAILPPRQWWIQTVNGNALAMTPTGPCHFSRRKAITMSLGLATKWTAHDTRGAGSSPNSMMQNGRKRSKTMRRRFGAPRTRPAAGCWWRGPSHSWRIVRKRLSRVRQARRRNPSQTAFPAKPTDLRIPANSKATILLDQNWLTTAYPELIVSGGRGATINLHYAESLWLQGKREKGNRDEVEGKRFFGNPDVFLPDGGAHRMFRPLWWRTYRYVELSIETAGDALTLEDFSGCLHWLSL